MGQAQQSPQTIKEGIQTTWQELHANSHDDPPGVVPIPKRESPTEYAKVFSNDRTRCWEGAGCFVSRM
jgi:hypothetical protein